MRNKRSSKAHVTCALLMLVTASVFTGCEAPSKRLNAPPQGHTEYPHELQRQYVPMTDNAMLSDMSMSTINFVPHQAELNGSGVRRLQRYAQIMKTYGGTLHYDGVQDDRKLASQRIENMEDFLVNAGLERGSFKIERGLAGGVGMQSNEAIAIRKSSLAGQNSGGGEKSISPGEALKVLTSTGSSGGGGK